MNLLPAILIGGPPHAGKSVLFYSLTHALRERQIPHHAIRACLDGEGNWSQERAPEMVSQIRLSVKTEWPPSFVERITQDIEHRCLPFLVDMGGRPRGTQLQLFRRCTHAILLLREDMPDDTAMWQRFIQENGVGPLAHLYSVQNQEARITSLKPILEGTVTGLERHRLERQHGETFEQLVELVAALFRSYTPIDLEQSFFQQATGELINLHDFVSTGERWQPEMLPHLLANLPTGTPLALYGAAPLWVYAAAAAATGQQPLTQFDPSLKFGWAQPLAVETSTRPHPDVRIEVYTPEIATIVSIQIPTTRLQYFQPEPFPLPPVLAEQGLIIDGRIPYWLLTAVVRHYRDQRVPWLATHYASMNKAIIVYSRTDRHQPGDLIDMPSLQRRK